MNVADVAKRLGGAIAGGREAADNPVQGGYASDLLSDVMANARDGDVWVTLQKHVNIVAVAQLKNLAAIILVNGRQPESETVARADQHHVPIVTTAMSAFDTAGCLYETGIRGRGAS